MPGEYQGADLGDAITVVAGVRDKSGRYRIRPRVVLTPDPDGSVAVTEDGIGVGVLATDAQHGNRGGGTLHAEVSSVQAGFMGIADKTKLDGIPPGGGGGGVPPTRQVIAGAALTGGGDLSADRTFDVVAGNAISVAADVVDVVPAGLAGLGLGDDGFGHLEIPAGAVVNPMLANGPTESVIGVTGPGPTNRDDILCAPNSGHVLRDDGAGLLTFGTVATAGIADNAVTDTKLRDSAARSVIGRSAGTAGDPADIVAAADGQVLRRSGGTVGFGAVTDVQVFATPGAFVWTKPAGAQFVSVALVASGGGGGSGRKGAEGSARYGGGGGGGGSYTFVLLPASVFGATVNGVVATGGTGGGAQTTDSTNGFSGNAGNASSFDNIRATGGGQGGGGTTTAGASGSGGGGSGAAMFPGANGASGGAGTGGTSSNNTSCGAAGGGGGGGRTAANASSAGGNGGPSSRALTSQYIPGGTGGAAGNGGGTPANLPAGYNAGGAGGGGGGAASGGVAGAGGNGGVYGAGGGGGGAGIDASVNSGAGGNGADGVVVVVTYG